MRKIKFIAIFLFASMVFGACAESMKSDETFSSNTNAVPMESSQVAEKADDGGGGGGGDKSVANPQAPVTLEQADKSKEEPATVTERKIIRNANLELEMASPEEAQQKITAIANNKKGFVITSTKSNANSKVNGQNQVSMTIRVPADKFQESLEEIRKTADRIIVETVTGQDVTEEFVDIQARLKTKKALEERYLEIMKQAKSVADALEVERQLGEIRTQIEQIEGRKRFLENQASLSTINVELRTPVAISGSSTGFFYELKQAISDGFEAALTFILVLVRVLIALLPFLILIVLPILLFLRFFWRKYKKKRTAKKILEEEMEELDVE
jgi:hypothetical protein